MSISSVIKNPALGIFNRLPLRRLRASSPAPGGFGELGAQRLRPGAVCGFGGRKEPPPPGTGRQRVGSPECVKRDANSLIADGVPRSWDQREGECTPGARPQHSPSSEEKEAEVSMALWKFSSIFRPSSMLGPGRGDLQRGRMLLASVPLGRGARSLRTPGKGRRARPGCQNEPRGSSPSETSAGWEG